MNRVLEVIVIVLGVVLFAVLAPLRQIESTDPQLLPPANDRPVQALQDHGNDLQSQIDAANRALDDINAEIAALQSDIANLQRQISQNTGDIESFQSRVAGNAKSVAALQTIAAFVRHQIKLLELQDQNVVTGSCIGRSTIRLTLPNDAVFCELADGEVQNARFGSISGFPRRRGAIDCAVGQ